MAHDRKQDDDEAGPPRAGGRVNEDMDEREDVSTDGEDAGEQPASERVYRAIRRSLVSGAFIPGRPMTLRGLASDLGVSPMPVRAAVARLAAERALAVSRTRRVFVPELSRAALEELMEARLVLEPEAAVRALPGIDPSRQARLRAIDDRLEACLAGGDVAGYMAANHAFHFTIYEAAPSIAFTPLIAQLWLQFGPFMRTVYARIGTADLPDQHEAAMAAIARGDGDGLRSAIANDIRDGMSIIAATL
jgi:DNA-binding GntR family transcriptional regulator